MIIQILVLNSFITVIMAFELWLIVRDRRQGKGNTEKDRGTRYLNILSITIGLTSAVILSILTDLNFIIDNENSTFWIGFGVMLIGLSLRVWSVFMLGGSFRTTVEIHGDQAIVKNGPYKLIRHPSYSGLLLICLGYGIAVHNWLSLLIVFALPLAALLYRIRVEEAFMVELFGSEYEEYKLHTKRLIPWIW